MPPRSLPPRTRPCYSHRRNGTLHRFIAPHHGPAVRRQRPGRWFYSHRRRRSLRRPSCHRLPLDEDLQALLRRPPARPRRIRPRPPRRPPPSQQPRLGNRPRRPRQPQVVARLRTAMFVLQRPQVPNTGWSMPEPAPDPDGEKLVDSAVIQDYDRLPGLYNIERDDPAETAPPEPPPAAESPVHPLGCNPMLRDVTRF